MQKKIKNGIYVVKGREILTENLEQGDGVLLLTDHASIIIDKTQPDQNMSWDAAMKHCEEISKKLPDRHQALEIAINHEKINDALEVIGGDKITNDWYWTNEERSSIIAWYYFGSLGSMLSIGKNSSLSVRPVTAF
jgi:hypothetical protein